MPRLDSAPPARLLLRRATSRLHHRIDRESVLAGLIEPDVTMQLYRSAMRALDGAYREIDSLFRLSGDLCPPGVPAYSPRTPSIRKDLAALGEDVNVLRVPQSPVLKPPQTEAAYLGIRYVVEGSQLGSRFIYSRLHAAFGNELREFGSFWTPDRAIQNSWDEVLKGLAGVDSRDALAAAAWAARQTFRHMERHLSIHETSTDWPRL